MPGLVETLLMSPQSYSRMECGGKMIVIMDTRELIFTYGSTLLVRCDAEKNLILLASCHDCYFAEVIGSVQKCVTDAVNFNLS